LSILITGNLGYVGTNLTSNLESLGYKVFGIDSGFYSECHLVPNGREVSTRLKDIRDLEISDFNNIDSVIHLAALSLKWLNTPYNFHWINQAIQEFFHFAYLN